ncbi:MAG: N-6 DNA methylase, partial [Gammaproteobacteria bacterium]
MSANDEPIRTYIAAVERAMATGQASEHTHRPALEVLLEALGGAGVDAINEPRQIACGAPDFIVVRGTVPLGHVEAKDVGVDLAKVEKTEQLLRYRESLANLILTDYLSFRWYLDGQLRLSAHLPRPGANGRIRWNAEAAAEVSQLLQQFLLADIPLKSTPHDLATRMAGMARLIRDLIIQTFRAEGDSGELHGQREAFRRVLIESLTTEQFADMYAQTLCYGLFAARCNSPAVGFTRQTAASALPKTNPFLRRLFGTIAGPNLDERIAWAVDQLAVLLARADMNAILADFGRRTRQEDPVVHFYETFLAAYDPKMREARGVYYTPEPVVGWIVRSIDAILRHDFGMKEGLAHARKIRLKRPKAKGKGEETYETHRLQILDPATGTGTFLYAVIQKIREHFDGNAGAWPGYVAEHLLPRLFGFELLMAPYAVAHMKLGLELEQSGYDFRSDERLGVFLTNSLEEAHELTGLPLFTQWLAEESRAASNIKRDAPVMVVLGNPPYSGHSANTGEWIAGLLRGHDSLNKRDTENYFEVDGKPLGERNPKWLNDDYVKFIRFAQWRIEQTGHGVLGFVTNHGYLDNPTFRGMRESLMRGFDEIYLLDLHGNSKKKETAPDGGKDENVFDI